MAIEDIDFTKPGAERLFERLYYFPH